MSFEANNKRCCYQPRPHGRVNITPWDEFDPIANAILALVESQNVVQQAMKVFCVARDDGTFATLAEVDAAFRARTDASSNCSQRRSSTGALRELDRRTNAATRFEYQT